MTVSTMTPTHIHTYMVCVSTRFTGYTGASEVR